MLVITRGYSQDQTMNPNFIPTFESDQIGLVNFTGPYQADRVACVFASEGRSFTMAGDELRMSRGSVVSTSKYGVSQKWGYPRMDGL